MAETSYLTPEGYDKLHEELQHLRLVRRLEIAEHIRIAKEDGDLTENAGYDAAKYEQSIVEGRIRTLESILHGAQIIDSNGRKDRVVLGCTIKVQEEGYDPEAFQIVGSPEADPSQGRISHQSPLGRAVLGRRVGDTVEVNAPSGVSTFTILAIE
ncbi:MAG: transcription elongation factor GreA [Anaerolineae bacterium]|nr:transcription elongation factor GreA [Anaerolineae bacterium]